MANQKRQFMALYAVEGAAKDSEGREEVNRLEATLIFDPQRQRYLLRVSAHRAEDKVSLSGAKYTAKTFSIGGKYGGYVQHELQPAARFSQKTMDRLSEDASVKMHLDDIVKQYCTSTGLTLGSLP